MKDVVAFCRCSPRTVSNLMLAGMPYIKIGHLVRFDPDEVIAWMKGGRSAARRDWSDA